MSAAPPPPASASPPPAKAKGLEGIVAAQSSICFIDGDKGVLSYRGYDINELAPHATFEETTFLLWEGHLPTRGELDEFTALLAANRELPALALKVLKAVAKAMGPMDALRTTVSALAAGRADADKYAVEVDRAKAIETVAQLATIVAYYHRIRMDKELVHPDPELGHAANFLYMLTGKKPTPAAERAFDVALVLHADHDLNASTFSARVTAATLADYHGAITSAVGTLKGPLHGGANIEVMKTLLEIDASHQDPEDWVEHQLAKKRKIAGFGHRVYKTLDPRAIHLAKLSKSLGEQAKNTKWYDMSLTLQKAMKRQKDIDANVDFFSASSYYVMGIPLDLYTPIFALSRIAGWSAHILEQHGDNRLIRPLSDYVGPPLGRKWVPIAKRSPPAKQVEAKLKAA
ncbi:MAG TPA: citrate/2-methylcitrate synthase [Candidatus Thermoplasmatota archaeon]|nr:citrate/2-methylcitrate synthase [Candidatus Thermoplasmatota archaeon]